MRGVSVRALLPIPSSSWDACGSTSWGAALPPGPAAAPSSLLQVASPTSVIAPGTQALGHRKLVSFPSHIGAEQFIRICFIVFPFLLLSPVNVTTKEQLLAFQGAPVLIIHSVFKEFEWLFLMSSLVLVCVWGWEKDSDTSTGGRKHYGSRASAWCVGDTSFTVCCQQTV